MVRTYHGIDKQTVGFHHARFYSFVESCYPSWWMRRITDRSRL